MYKNELYHHGVKGQKWGVRRYQNKDGGLTAAGKMRMRKLNKLNRKDDEDRYWREEAANNIDKFSKKKNPVAKLLTKTNTKSLSAYDKTIEKNSEKIGNIIKELKDQKIDVVLRYNQYEGRMYYKQSDAQIQKARDNKLYRKEGIKITRDDSDRIVSIKADDVNKRTVKRINKIAQRGYY